MKKVFLDTNILIDYLARRGQAADSVKLVNISVICLCAFCGKSSNFAVDNNIRPREQAAPQQFERGLNSPCGGNNKRIDNKDDETVTNDGSNACALLHSSSTRKPDDDRPPG